MQNKGRVIIPDIETSITGGKKIVEQIDEDTTHVFIRGAVTSKVLKDICQSEFIKNIKSPSGKCLKGFACKGLVEASRRFSQLFYILLFYLSQGHTLNFKY